MTEKEKLLRGEFYNSRDSELLAMYFRARQLLSEYNASDASDYEARNNVLIQLLGSIGMGVWIEAPFFCDYGVHISIGDYSFINMNCIFLDDHHITIGKNCLIAPNVQIYTANHPLKAAERIDTRHVVDPASSPYKTMAKPVSIGDNVWIGGNAVILPGVTIGKNTTIGAGSVVTQDIPDNVLAAGSPCKMIRSL